MVCCRRVDTMMMWRLVDDERVLLACMVSMLEGEGVGGLSVFGEGSGVGEGW